MDKKHNNIYKPLSYIEHVFMLTYAVTRYLLNCIYASSVNTPTGIMIYSVR